jgi:hypothetical protein
MAKSTRQYVFEGMELLPEALIPFVEKRLETSLKGHWQVEVVERVQGLRPNGNGQVGWDQQGLLKTMMAFWKDAFRRRCLGIRALLCLRAARRAQQALAQRDLHL